MSINNKIESYEKCRENLLNIVYKIAVDISESEEKNTKFNESIINEIFFKKFIPIDKKNSTKDIFLSIVANGFKEISISFGRLKDLELYISNFPTLKEPIKKADYLRFLIENYLYEIYILKERLNKYTKKIMNSYIEDKRYISIRKACNLLANMVEKNLENIISIRGKHIHQARYSDKDIDRLVSLFLYQEFLDEMKKILSSHYIIPNFQNEYKNLRKKWKKIFQENNKQIKILLNSYFEVMINIVFNDSGEILYPNKSKSIQNKKRFYSKG
jgi:hypothetical protein